MQIDFGEKKLFVAGQLVKVFLLVAVLSHSRRLYVRAFLNQRGDDWREGIAAAFRRFGERSWTRSSRIPLGASRRTSTSSMGLLSDEMAAKQRKRVAMGIQIAHFPAVKTLEDFDFKAQPSIDAKLVRELATGHFIPQAENVLLFGPPGVGKTHLAIALGRSAVEAGHSVLFVSATALLTNLAKAEVEGQLKEKLSFFAKPKLLVIDELGYLPFEKRSAHLFFQLVARRYERGSMLITTNQLVAQWGSVFGDDVLAAAILDRLLHHSHTRMIQGDSYRLRQKRKAGLLKSSTERS